MGKELGVDPGQWGVRKGVRSGKIVAGSMWRHRTSQTSVCAGITQESC